MWLINVQTLALEYFMGQTTPDYAILSHTWEDEEVSFQDMRQLTPDTRNKKGFAKIRETCRLAASEGYAYAWVDTCCIDKSSSAELTEAINSMYRWYRHANVCYAYLSDVDYPANKPTLAASRWFTRGWTLQELIAPQSVVFWTRNWVRIGSKHALGNSLQTITNIPVDLLRNHSILDDYSIARRLSWAARRETTRVEDTAYCLLGLFNINMSLLYGEGSNAFYRLQEELVKSTTDASLFAWSEDRVDNRDSGSSHNLVSIFASHPRCFANSKYIPVLDDTIHESMTITNRGIALRVSLGVVPSPFSEHTYVLCLGTVPAESTGSAADAESRRTVCVYLRQTLPGQFSRYYCNLMPIVTSAPRRLSFESIYLTTRIAASGIDPPRDPERTQVDRDRACRVSALRIEVLPPGTRRTDVYPVSNFDVHDDVFFSTSREPGGGGWAIFSVEGVFTSAAGVEYPLDLMCCVFDWARDSQPHWPRAAISVLVNRRAETHTRFHTLQLDSMTRHFERDGDIIRRMLANYYGGVGPVVKVEPDRRKPGGETADVMVACLVVKRVDVRGEAEYLAPCRKYCIKVGVLLVPSWEEAMELVYP